MFTENFHNLSFHPHTYLILLFPKVTWKVHRLKSSYNDVISSVDDILDQLDPSTATPIKELYDFKGGYIKK